MTRPAILAGRYRPHEMLLLAVSIIIGLAYLLGAPPATSLAALIPRWELHAWAIGMLTSGILGLLGTLWQRRDLPRGLALEAAGLLIGSGALLLYLAAILRVAGPAGLSAGGIVAAWMLANLWRTAQVRTDLRGL